ncbi:MAG: glycosyltransferase family 39 protein [Chloroflexota bacterium]
MDRLSPISKNQLQYLLLCVLVILSVVLLHMYQFDDYNYRQDEAWHVYLVLENNPAQILTRFQQEVHPPGWILLLDAWVGLVGHHEVATRHASTLLMSMSLALLIRLGADITHKAIGIVGAILLGVLPFIQFFAHEIRPYSTLLMLTIAFSLLYLRWQLHRTVRYSLALFLVGVCLVYTHYYGAFVVLAHGLVSLILLKKDWSRLIQLFSIMGLIAGTLIAWLILVYQSISDLGVSYFMDTSWETLRILYEQMMMHPTSTGIFLFAVAMVMPKAGNQSTKSYFRFGQHWSNLYLILVPLIMLGVIFSINLLIQTVTPRNMIVIVPFFALLLASAMRDFRTSVICILLTIITVASIVDYRPLVSNAAYREVGEHIQAQYRVGETGIVIATPAIWEQIPVDYYLSERTSLDIDHTDLFNITVQEALAVTPIDYQYHVTDIDDTSLELFERYIADKHDIWWVYTSEFETATMFLDTLKQDFAFVQEITFSEGYMRDVSVALFRRVPEDTSNGFVFGTIFDLLSWQLRDDVQVVPCQEITVDSFWTLANIPETNFVQTLTLADRDGQGIAQVDAPPADTLTLLWEDERIYVDERTLTIPCDIEAGSYDLLIGLYDDSVNLLNVVNRAGDDVGSIAYLTTLSVDAP